MLLALSLVSVGNGFFKPNISTIVGSLYDAGRPAAGCRLHHLLHGHQPRLDPRPVVLPVARRLVRLVGRLRPRRRRHADQLCADPVRWRPARRLWRAARPTRRNRDLVIYVGALVAVPVVRVPVLQPDELARRPSRARASSAISCRCRSWASCCSGPSSSASRRSSIWSYAKGTAAEFQMMTAAMVLIVFNVVFWTLFEQAGSSLTLFADRNTDRSVFGLFTHVRAADAELQPDLHRPARAADEHAVDGARQARARAVDPGQVRDRADGRRRRLPVPGLGHAFAGRQRLQGRRCGGWPAST